MKKRFPVKKLLFILADLAALNTAFFSVASVKIFGLQFTEGSFRDVAALMLWSNLYLSPPWILFLLPFGFYDRVWRLSFFQVFLAVTTGIFLFKFLDIATNLLSGNPANIIPTPTGLKLILLYWLLLLLLLFLFRSFCDFLDKGLAHGRPTESIEGAGYTDKDFGISTGLAMTPKPWGYLALKRVIDITGACFALLIFLPTLLVLSLLIKITDPKGPVFFRQSRLGWNGRVFRIFKFRTMISDAEERLKRDRVLYEEYLRNNFKLPPDRDPRITRVGSFLRRTSLDELPQLFNVLLGDMAMVGPRPIVVDELTKYDKYAKKFLSVKPGLTGWWQVAGRSNIDYPDRIYLEMYYVENASTFFDVRILLQTVPTVLFARGAH